MQPELRPSSRPALDRTSPAGHSAALASASPASRALAFSRWIAAPRAEVFDVWLRRLPEWWGPHGTCVTSCEVEAHAGGVLRTVMRAPDGSEYLTSGVFLEIAPPERIVFTDAFEPGWRPHGDAFFTAVVTFAEEHGGTQYTVRALHWTAESCRRHEGMGFHQGWGESSERLAALAGQAPPLPW